MANNINNAKGDAQHRSHYYGGVRHGSSRGAPLEELEPLKNHNLWLH